MGIRNDRVRSTPFPKRTCRCVTRDVGCRALEGIIARLPSPTAGLMSRGGETSMLSGIPYPDAQ